MVRVARQVASALGWERTYVATDDDRIEAVCSQHEIRVVRTSERALTGTDRVAEAARSIDADLVLNIQGDEPMVAPRDIEVIAARARDLPGWVVNGMHKLAPGEDPHDVNIPKVVYGSSGRLLYMSRAAVPATKSLDATPPVFMKQVCIYAYRRAELERFASRQEKAPAELHEDIEILRFLDLGIPVQMVETSTVSLAIDRPEDVQKVERALHDTSEHSV